MVTPTLVSLSVALSAFFFHALSCALGSITADDAIHFIHIICDFTVCVLRSFVHSVLFGTRNSELVGTVGARLRRRFRVYGNQLRVVDRTLSCSAVFRTTVYRIFLTGMLILSDSVFKCIHDSFPCSDPYSRTQRIRCMKLDRSSHLRCAPGAV